MCMSQPVAKPHTGLERGSSKIDVEMDDPDARPVLEILLSNLTGCPAGRWAGLLLEGRARTELVRLRGWCACKTTGLPKRRARGPTFERRPGRCIP